MPDAGQPALFFGAALVALNKAPAPRATRKAMWRLAGLERSAAGLRATRGATARQTSAAHADASAFSVSSAASARQSPSSTYMYVLLLFA